MLSADTHAHLAAHLTARDVWLLHMLWEHRVLTSHHIADLAFTTDRKARRRLLQLHDLGLLDRFRPRLPVGSAPWHYVLGAAGAAVLAAQAGTTARALRYRRDTTIAIAFHHTLAHTTAINTFFAALAHASTHPPPAAAPVTHRRGPDLMTRLAHRRSHQTRQRRRTGWQPLGRNGRDGLGCGCRCGGRRTGADATSTSMPAPTPSAASPSTPHHRVPGLLATTSLVPDANVTGAEPSTISPRPPHTRQPHAR